MKGLRGLATGIGSLPYRDADEALEVIFKYVPDIPFWPQLPKRDIREGMVAQFSENLPCLRIAREGLFFSALEDKDKELEIFYERIIAGETDYFKISKDFALGLYKFYQRLENSDLKNIEFIKCQITGPFTFAASIKDEKGKALLHDSVFMQAILKGLQMKALWQIKLFKKFGKKIIMFLDEPYLGCFGSAYTPINREDVVKGLSELTGPIKSDNVLIGVHCCGNTDWSIFTDIQAIDIINFDAFGFLDKLVLYAGNLNDFLKRGGILCWGIVPTQEFTGQETVASFEKKIKEGIDILGKKGVDKDLLLSRLLISPACGLGTLDIRKSENIFRLLSELSSSIGKTP
ncbi:MAG: methionine synthase [Candidatus Omnitrophica bacterium]|nr:methionine synthase [Candidatus Omnitrophota bacterium]MDD5592920.1 methionine synthase [Candidatus Omnitrophota bacterium]